MPNTPFADLLPPLGEEEFSALEASVRAEGVRDPVLMDEDENVLDGHHRLKLDPNAPRHTIPGSGAWSMARRQAFVFQANFVRRNLSGEQKIEVDDERRRVAWELYQETNGDGQTRIYSQAEIGTMLGAPQQTVADWIRDLRCAVRDSVTGAGNAIPTDQENDQATATGSTTTQPAPQQPKARNVKLDPEDRAAIYDRWQEGRTQKQIAADYQISAVRVKQVCAQEKARREEESRQAATHTPEIPQKIYRCLVVDPPWPMKKLERLERPNQGRRLPYSTMSLEEIQALPIPTLADERSCHLYLWVTQRFLPDGLRLLQAWGFSYHCLLTWVKPTGMTPHSWMFNTEHVLFGYRGKLNPGRKGLKVAFEAPAPRGKHSTKPDVFFDRVREFSKGRRLEMFARKPHEGFEGWGNEFQN